MIALIDAIKAGVDILVSVGTGTIIGKYTGKAVKNAKGFERVCAAVAAVAIEGFVATKASGYLTDQIDEIASKIHKPDDEDYEEDEDERV